MGSVSRPSDRSACTARKQTNRRTYRSRNLYRDLGHFQISLVEVCHGFLGGIGAFEPNEPDSSVGENMGIGRLEAIREMFFELFIGACWRETRHEYPRVLHSAEDTPELKLLQLRSFSRVSGNFFGDAKAVSGGGRWVRAWDGQARQSASIIAIVVRVCSTF